MISLMISLMTTSGSLNRGGLADLPMLRTLSDILSFALHFEKIFLVLSWSNLWIYIYFSEQFFISGLIQKDKSWSINKVLLKGDNRILKHFCLKHDFSFIDQSNALALPNGDLDPSLFFQRFFPSNWRRKCQAWLFILQQQQMKYVFHLALVKGIHIVIFVKIKLQFLLIWY